MRGLRHLIPESWNSNPAFQWAAVALIAVIGAFIAYKGVRGFLDRRITDKRGRVYEGGAAQALGVVYALIGAALVVASLAFKLLGE